MFSITALKISNGSYIMNGEFAVSVPGTYDAAGARFLYTRTAGLDHVFTAGPILHPIDIMVSTSGKALFQMMASIEKLLMLLI